MSSTMPPPLEDALLAAAVLGSVPAAMPSAVERHLCARINRRLLHRIPSVPPHIIKHEVAAFVEHHSLDFDKLSCRISNTLQYFDMLLDLIERRAAAAGYEEKVWLRHLREVDALYATADAAAAGVAAATADDADGRGGDGGDFGGSRGTPLGSTSGSGGTDADSAGSTIGGSGGGGGGGGGSVAQVTASFMDRMKAQWASEAKTEAKTEAAAAQIIAQLGPDSDGGEQEALSAALATSKTAAATTIPFSAAASKAAPSTPSTTSATSAFAPISSSTSTAAAAASTPPTLTVPTLPTTPSAPVLTPRSPRGSPRGTWVGEGWRTPPRTFRQMLRRRKPQGKAPHGNHGKPSPNIGKHRAYSPASRPASSHVLGGEAGKARGVDEEPLIEPAKDLKEPLKEHSEDHNTLLLSPPVSPPVSLTPISLTPVPLPLTAAVALVQRAPMTRGQIRQQIRMSEGAWSDLALWCTFAPLRMREQARRAHVRRLVHGYEVRVQRAWALLSSPPP